MVLLLLNKCIPAWWTTWLVGRLYLLALSKQNRGISVGNNGFPCGFSPTFPLHSQPRGLSPCISRFNLSLFVSGFSPFGCGFPCALNCAQPRALPDVFPVSSLLCRPCISPYLTPCGLPRIPGEVSPKFPVHLPRVPHVFSRSFHRVFPVSSLLHFPCICCGFPDAFSRPIHRTFIERIMQFILFPVRTPCVPRRFHRRFLAFPVHVSLWWLYVFQWILRWVPAIFVVPSLFVTPRVSYALSGTFSCTDYSTSFLFNPRAFPSTFSVFS